MTEVKIKLNWIESINEIRRAQENNQLVIFVGSGVSKNSGVPTWNELIIQIADRIGYDKCDFCKKSKKRCQKMKCELRGDFTQDEFLRIPEYYYRRDNSDNHAQYYEFIRNTLKSNAGPNPIDDEIFAILPHHIITTNYDSLLEDSTAINS